MQFVRFAVLGLVILTVVYWTISVYSRSVRREKLEEWWDELNAEGRAEVDRETYVQEGLAEYDKGIRPKLILLVYVIPIIAVSALVYVIN